MFAQGNHGDNVHETCMERVGGSDGGREKYESNCDDYYDYLNYILFILLSQHHQKQTLPC